MSLRGQPRSIPERIAWIEEFIRRWEVAQQAAFPVEAFEPCERHTLLYHHPGTLSVTTGEPFYPAFGADIYFVRINCATAPTAGALVVDLLFDGVSGYTTSPKPMINQGSVFSLQAAPDHDFWIANQKLQIEIESTGSATGLVVAIEHCRLGIGS